MLNHFVILLLVLFKANSSVAFAIRNHGILTTDVTSIGFKNIYYNEKCSSSNIIYTRQKTTVVLSSPPDRDSGADVLPAAASEENNNNSIPPAVPSQENKGALQTKSDNSSYPINLPSPILLGASVVLAISSIGM